MQIVSRQVDSAFGRWTQTECRPRHLAGVVDQICHFSGTVAHAHERVFPNGVVELIVHLDHRYRLVTNDLAEVCPETCVGGLQTRAMVVQAPAAACTVLGIRLRQRSGKIRDPFGHLWHISTRIEELSSAEMQRRYDKVLKEH
jgi:Domain of unknown function (DUF6597)